MSPANACGHLMISNFNNPPYLMNLRLFLSASAGAVLTMPFVTGATVLIDDGSTYLVASATVAGADFDTDHQVTAGGGTLHITSSGTLILNQPRMIANTHGEGELLIEGILEHNASLSSTVAAATTVPSGGTVRSLASSLVFTADSEFLAGSAIEAQGGNVALAAGTHRLGGTSILGTGSLDVRSGGTLVVNQSVGPLSGPATGGLSIHGGTVHDFFSILGGAGLGTISVDHGTLGDGTIGTTDQPNVKIRYTGNVSKSPGTTLGFVGGLLRNEGTFTHHDTGVIDLDPLDQPGAGHITNDGTWNLLGEARISNTRGGGSFTHNGLLQTPDTSGNALVAADFTATSGSEIRAAAGSVLTLLGQTKHETGSVIHSDGRLVFGFGAHEWWSPTIDGGGWVEAGVLGGLGGMLGGTNELRVQTPVGPATGPATGGFHLNGATLLDSSLGLGGPGFGQISTARGKLSAGHVAGASLRFTTSAEMAAGGEVGFSRGFLRNEGTFTHHDGGVLNLDSSSTAGGGTAVNDGTWNLLGEARVTNIQGGGSFINHGLLQTPTAGAAAILAASLESTDGSEIRTVVGSSLILAGQTNLAAGTTLHSDGALVLGSGNHELWSPVLSGSGYLEARGLGALGGLLGNVTNVRVQLPVGPVDGPATGGFHLNGANLLDSSLGLGGLGSSQLSAGRGLLESGRIDGATLRLTGASTKTADSEIEIARGFLRNDGTLVQESGGMFDLDPDDEPAVFGTIINRGNWQLVPGAGMVSSHGEGRFENQGLLEVLPGAPGAMLSMALTQLDGGTLRVPAGGSLTLSRGTSHGPGSTLDLDGTLHLTGSLHLLRSTTLTGSGALRLAAGNTHVDARVGPETGAATGGIILDGGSLRDRWDTGGLGGGGSQDPTHGQINASHGELRSGTIQGATLRLTGPSSQPGAATVTIRSGAFVNDGTHTQLAGGNYELDPSSASDTGGGIVNRGLWLSQGASTIADTHGGGWFRNEGTLRQASATGALTLATDLDNAGGTIHAAQGIINLNGGATFGPGSELFADGEAIFLRNGPHTFHGGSLRGNQYTYFTSGTAQVLAPVGADNGPATGRFGLNGGTISGTHMLSAATGWLHSGEVTGGVTLRLTGDSLKPASGQLNMNGGTIRNEGAFVHEAGGVFELDRTSSTGAGLLDNRGQWTLAGNATFSNSYGGGVFENHGQVLQQAGTVNLAAAFRNQPGGTFESLGGTTNLSGGGIHQPGSTLRANGGTIRLSGGTHRFLGGQFEGPGFIHAAGGTIRIEGDVGPASGPASGGFAITGGSVTGTGMISVDRAYFASGSISGNVVLRVTGDLSQQDASTLVLNGGTLINESSTNQAITGNFDLDNSSDGTAGHLVNNGLWQLDRSVTYLNSFGGGTFENRGLFEVLDGTVDIRAAFHHAENSTMRIAGGQILLRGGGTMAPGVTIDTQGGPLYFDSGTHTLSGGVFTGSDFAYVSGGNTVIAGVIGGPSGGFGIAGGTVSGTGTLTAQRGFVSTGLVTGTATLRFTSSITKPAGTTLNMNGGTIVNLGSFEGLAGSNFNLDVSSSAGAGTLINEGTWNLNAAATYDDSFDQGIFENRGLFHAIAGNSTIHPAFHHAAGSVFRVSGGQVLLRGGGTMAAGTTIDAAGGDLYFRDGTHTLNGGVFTGPGFAYVTGGTAVIAGDLGGSSGGFGIAGGTVSGTASLTAERGWLSTGLVTGTPSLRFTGTITKPTGTTLNMNGGTIVNLGTFDGQAGSNFNLDVTSTSGAGTLVNEGAWILNAAATYDDSFNEGIFENRGLFHAISGNSSIEPTFHHAPGSVFRISGGQVLLRGGGTMAAGTTVDAAGGDLYFAAGTHTLNGGVFTGSGFAYASGGTTVVAADLGGPSGGFGIAGGTVSGTATLTAERGYFSTGSMTGTPTLRYTGSITKPTGTTFNMNGGTIINAGVYNGLLGSNFNLDQTSTSGAGTLVNEGAWILNAAATYDDSFDQGIFENHGLFHSIAGNSSIHPTFHHIAGSVFRISSGQVLLRGGGTVAPGATIDTAGGDLYFRDGTHTLHGGVFTGSGFAYVSGGTTVIAGNVGGPSGGFGLAGGTVSGTATLTAERGYFSTGSMLGTPTLRFTGSITKPAGTTLNMNGGTIINAGVFHGLAGSDFNLDLSSTSGAGTLVNDGTWNLNGGATYSDSFDQGAIINRGHFRVLDGSSNLHASFTNSGVLEVAGGTLTLSDSSSHSGRVIANGSLVFGVTRSHALAGPGALLGGSGWLYGTARLSDGARLTPGNSPGTLHLAGTLNFTRPASAPVVEIELASPGASDLIALENNAMLALGSGVTELRLVLRAAPQPGDVFRIVNSDATSGRFTGTFANAPANGDRLTGIFEGDIHEFAITYDPSGTFIELQPVAVTSPYDDWAIDKGLSGADAEFTGDSDNDGIPNGIEFVLGTNPRIASTSEAPTLAIDEDSLTFTFRRAAEAAYLGAVVQYGPGLGDWSHARHGVDGVEIVEIPDGFAPGIDRVEVTLPRNLATGKSFFTRLSAP